MAEGEAWDRFRAMMAQAGLTCTPTKFLPLGMDSVTILSCTSVRLFGAEVLLPRRPGCDRAPGGNGPVYGPYTPYAAFNDAQRTQGVAGLKFDALKGTSLPLRILHLSLTPAKPNLIPHPHAAADLSEFKMSLVNLLQEDSDSFVRKCWLLLYSVRSPAWLRVVRGRCFHRCFHRLLV